MHFTLRAPECGFPPRALNLCAYSAILEQREPAFSGRMSPARGKNGRFQRRPALAQKLLPPNWLPQTTGRNNTETGPHVAEGFHHAHCDALLACARHRDRLADGGMIRSYHYGAVIADMMVTETANLSRVRPGQGNRVISKGSGNSTGRPCAYYSKNSNSRNRCPRQNDEERCHE